MIPLFCLQTANDRATNVNRVDVAVTAVTAPSSFLMIPMHLEFALAAALHWFTTGSG